jgi:tRNA pseudouridine38-40 synthase
LRFRATLAYDGAPYQGYQRQLDGIPTVQGTVETALTRINGGDFVTVYAAGRTDSGVHATGQVIAFDLDWRHSEDALYRAINANLPNSVAVLKVQQTRDDFHPRFDAQWREYEYTMVWCEHPLPLQRHTMWITSRPFDPERMTEGAKRLHGKRDWGALGTPPQGDNTVRQIHESAVTVGKLDISAEHTRVKYRVRADAFLYRMVRRIVGCLYDIGRGKLSLAAFEQAIECTEIMRGVTIAPPQGLILTQVRYEDDKKTDIS